MRSIQSRNIVVPQPIYCPPYTLCARWLGPLDHRNLTLTSLGAAFIALAAVTLDEILQSPA